MSTYVSFQVLAAPENGQNNVVFETSSIDETASSDLDMQNEVHFLKITIC